MTKQEHIDEMGKVMPEKSYTLIKKTELPSWKRKMPNLKNTLPKLKKAL